MSATALDTYLARSPHRRFHPDDWDAIHAARTRFLDDIRAVVESGATLAKTPLRTPPPSYFFAYDGMDELALQRETSAFLRAIVPGVDFVAPHCRGVRGGSMGRGGRRLRLAVVSAKLWYQTIGHYMVSILWGLPRDRFEVVLVKPGGTTQDPVARLLDRLAQRVVAPAHALLPTIQAVARLEADIVLFPDVGMNTLSMLLAQTRLAPVQCVTYGHPVTTGSPTMDYYLSSRLIEPDDGPMHYTERLVQMHDLPWQVARPPHLTRRADRAEFGLPAVGRLYYCFQMLYKIHPEFDAILDGILRKDPAAHVVLPRVENWEPDALLQRLTRTLGERAERVHFVGWVPNPDIANFYALADVHLDPIHFGGGRTAFEAMAAGVPVITWPAPFMRGRLMHGLYRQMDIMECVATDAADYVERAVAIANDDARKADLAAKIKARRHVLFQTEAPALELASFFEHAHDAAARGEGPIAWS